MKPIAWYDPSNGVVSTDRDSPLFTPLGQVWPLFSQRPWVGLTLDERIELAQDVDWPAGAYCEYAEKIEDKLRSKNT